MAYHGTKHDMKHARRPKKEHAFSAFILCTAPTSEFDVVQTMFPIQIASSSRFNGNRTAKKDLC